MQKNIELELRAEIPKSDFGGMLGKLKRSGKLISKTRRLSVMYFGGVGRKKFDIRVRITNGDSEVVIKKGSTHSHNRIEVSRSIEKSQFIGMVKIMAELGFYMKVGERENYNFDFGDGVMVSLVKAGSVSYLEIEKMSTPKEQKLIKKELIKIASSLDVKLIKNRKEFLNLCDRLSNGIDWKFNQTGGDYKKLTGLLGKF